MAVEGKRTQCDYTLAFKLGGGAVEKGEFTYKQAQRSYEIQGPSTELVWLRKHRTRCAQCKAFHDRTSLQPSIVVFLW
jgi:hypothetical protein